MKKILALSLISFAAIAVPALAAPPPAIPAPKILVIDRAAILTQSKVGQDVARQAKAYSDQAKADLAAQAKSLQAQEQALQQQIAILAPDVKNQKIKEFQGKEAALQALVTKKEQMIQYGVYLANQTMAQAVGPIVKQLMQERGANMVLDRNSVVSASDSSFDVTAMAIDRLNQKLSSLKVNLASPPAAPGAAQ
jgi:Skp family chaperone for outer membrane proteins